MIAAPEDTINNLNDLNAQLDTIRDNITLNSSEVTRLQRLIQSLTYQIDQLHNDKTFCEQEIANMGDQKTTAQTDLSTLNDQISAAKDDLACVTASRDDMQKQLDDFRNGVNEEVQAVAQREADVSARENATTAREADLTKREDDIVQRDADSQAKSTRILNVYSSLQNVVKDL